MDAQIALSKSLALGVVFSLIPLLGLGSVTAIWIGVRGKKKIEASGQKLVGSGMAAWCVGAGIVGLILSVAFWLTVLANLKMSWP